MTEKEKDEVLREIRLAEEQLAEGQGVPHEEARRKVLESLERASRVSPHPQPLSQPHTRTPGRGEHDSG